MFRTNSVGWVAAELAFHELIWELSGNRWLADGLRRVMVPYFHYETAFRLELKFTDHRFAELHQLGFPLLSGTSRKSFLTNLRTKTARTVASVRLASDIAAVTASILQGAHLVRVHDVKEAVEAAAVADAILANEKCAVASSHSRIAELF